MASGPGKYDPECMAAMRATSAVGTVLIVIEGDRGSGFSVTTVSPELASELPGILRRMADEIEAST